MRGFGQPQCKCRDPLLQGLPLEVSRMQDQILGADDRRAIQFTAERCDRHLANQRIECGQIDKVVDMDGQWRKIEPRPGIAESLYVNEAGNSGAPHPRTG